MADQKAVLKRYNKLKTFFSKYQYVTLEVMNDEQLKLEITRMDREEWIMKQLIRPDYSCKKGTCWYPAWLTFRRLRRR